MNGRSIAIPWEDTLTFDSVSDQGRKNRFIWRSETDEKKYRATAVFMEKVLANKLIVDGNRIAGYFQLNRHGYLQLVSALDFIEALPIKVAI